MHDDDSGDFNKVCQRMHTNVHPSIAAITMLGGAATASEDYG